MRENLMQECLDEDHFFHSGDIGEWMANGALRIIDRKKALLKLAQGEYVSPERVENILIQSLAVANAFVHGDSLKSHLVAVVALDPAVLPLWASKHPGLKYAKEGAVPSFPELLGDDAVHKAVQADLERVAKEAGLNGFEVPTACHNTGKALKILPSSRPLSSSSAERSFLHLRMRLRDSTIKKSNGFALHVLLDINNFFASKLGNRLRSGQHRRGCVSLKIPTKADLPARYIFHNRMFRILKNAINHVTLLLRICLETVCGFLLWVSVFVGHMRSQLFPRAALPTHGIRPSLLVAAISFDSPSRTLLPIAVKYCLKIFVRVLAVLIKLFPYDSPVLLPLLSLQLAVSERSLIVHSIGDASLSIHPILFLAFASIPIHRRNFALAVTVQVVVLVLLTSDALRLLVLLLWIGGKQFLLVVLHLDAAGRTLI